MIFLYIVFLFEKCLKRRGSKEVWARETAFSLPLSYYLSLYLSLSLPIPLSLSFSRREGGVLFLIFLIAKAAHPAWSLYSIGWVITIRFSDQCAPVWRYHQFTTFSSVSPTSKDDVRPVNNRRLNALQGTEGNRTAEKIQCPDFPSMQVSRVNEADVCVSIGTAYQPGVGPPVTEPPEDLERTYRPPDYAISYEVQSWQWCVGKVHSNYSLFTMNTDFASGCRFQSDKRDEPSWWWLDDLCP